MTDRDRVVAEIVTPREPRAAWVSDALFAEAVRTGWVTPPASAGVEPPRRKAVMKVRDLLREISTDRGEP